MNRTLLVLALTALLCVGCTGKYTGGGWIASAVDRDAKAHFGFKMEAISAYGDDIADYAVGQLQYHDKAAGVSFHGTIDNGVRHDGVLYQPADVGQFVGTYRPQPNGNGGRLRIYVYDRGTQGPSKGDVVIVECHGGDYDGYTNAQVLGGGNIKLHKDQD